MLPVSPGKSTRRTGRPRRVAWVLSPAADQAPQRNHWFTVNTNSWVNCARLSVLAQEMRARKVALTESRNNLYLPPTMAVGGRRKLLQ